MSFSSSHESRQKKLVYPTNFFCLRWEERGTQREHILREKHLSSWRIRDVPRFFSFQTVLVGKICQRKSKGISSMGREREFLDARLLPLDDLGIKWKCEKCRYSYFPISVGVMHVLSKMKLVLFRSPDFFVYILGLIMRSISRNYGRFYNIPTQSQIYNLLENRMARVR